ncbi:hypothetical protein ACS0TY_030588 [Phlomoides rotata]
MGDFNVVLGSHERSRGATRQTRPSEEFMEIIDDVHILDVDSSGSQFTWSTRRYFSGIMAAKLDRVLASQGFLDLWHNLEVTISMLFFGSLSFAGHDQGYSHFH